MGVLRRMRFFFCIFLLSKTLSSTHLSNETIPIANHIVLSLQLTTRHQIAGSGAERRVPHVSFLSLLWSQAARNPSRSQYQTDCLDSQSLNLVLQSADLAHQVGGLVGGDGGSNNGAGDTTSTAKGDLRGDVDVGSVLVLGQERNVQEDGQRGGVGGKDNDLSGSSVQSLGGLVGTLLELTVVAGRLDEVQDLLGHGSIGDGPSGGLVLVRHCVG